MISGRWAARGCSLWGCNRPLAALRQTSDSAHARLGAVSFIHRFGASLNRHVHFHCCVIDGVFEPVADTSGISEAVRFRPATALTPKAIAAIAEQVRLGVLRWFARPVLIDPDDVRAMLTWENSGFSLDASVRVAAQDRAGLERLLRSCARPPFALERPSRSPARTAAPTGASSPSSPVSLPSSGFSPTAASRHARPAPISLP